MRMTLSSGPSTRSTPIGARCRCSTRVSRPLGLPAGLFLVFVADLPRDVPGRLPAGRGRLARARTVGRLGRGLSLPRRQGREHRHEPPVRGDGPRSPGGPRPRLAGHRRRSDRPDDRLVAIGDLDRGGNDRSSVGRSPARDGAGSELACLGPVRPAVAGQLPDRACGRGAALVLAVMPGTGHQSPAGHDAARRPARIVLLDPERRAAESAAHAAAPLADAAVAGVVAATSPSPSSHSRHSDAVSRNARSSSLRLDRSSLGNDRRSLPIGHHARP